VTLGDLLAKVRLLLSEPSTVRWTNQYLISLINDAQNALAHEVDFPEASEHYGTVAGQREYQLVELVKILRVYVTNGISQQPLVGTDITLLEGRTRDMFDQGHNIQNNGQPQMTPQWLAQQPAAFPVIGNFSGNYRGPVATNSIWHNVFAHGSAHQRPEYYLRGGFLGLLPPPSITAAYDINGNLTSGFEIVVDHIPVPFGMQVSSDKSAFPTRFKDALCYRVVADCLFADKSSDYQAAEAKYNSECEKIRKWKESLQADKTKTYMVTTMRTYFKRRRTGWN
jgi:hypothetical protein